MAFQLGGAALALTEATQHLSELGFVSLPSVTLIHHSTNVGFPSVYCEYALLPLVDKEAALVYGRTE